MFDFDGLVQLALAVFAWEVLGRPLLFDNDGRRRI